MKESLNNKCKLFIENRDVFKAAFPMENSYLYPVCASFFVDRGELANVERLKEMRALLKSRVNVFSNFRSSAELSIISMLALDNDPVTHIDSAMEVYGELKEYFFSSEYLPVAAMIISGDVERERYGEICARTRRIYDLMRERHPMLTSGEDSVFVAMLALSEKSDEEIVEESECCYLALKEHFFNKDAVQSLSFVLALADDGMRTASDKCRDTVRLFESLKEKKYRYGTDNELATLGILAMLPCGEDETVRDIIETYEFLKTQKGYGFFGVGRAQTLMHAAMIVSSEHLGGTTAMQGAAVGSTLSLIAAQHAAICTAIAASVAASNAARHS